MDSQHLDVADSSGPIPLFDCRIDTVGNLVAELASGRVASGPRLSELENRLSAWFEGKEVVTVSDATHALSIALQLAGVKSGDDVMMLSYNCLSSTSAITNVGAKPVWIDIDPDTATVSLSDLNDAISRSTKALVVYHVAGYPAPLPELRRWCDTHSISLIEDANCAFGAMVQGIQVGTVGDFAVVSFYANRQINAIEGAALVCAKPGIADIARRLRKFGIDQMRFRDVAGEIDANCDVPVIGYSASLSNAHAALALSGLTDVDDRLATVRRNVRWLRDEAATFSAVQPVSWSSENQPAFWVWLVRSRRRDSVISDLKAMGISCSKLHHPNHTYTGFSSGPRSLPGTRIFAEEGFALPCGWWLGEPQIGRIIEALRRVSRNH